MIRRDKNAYKRYSSKKWKSFRKSFLHESPLCKNFDECKSFATEIDHIKAVASDFDEHFYDTNNLQGLCKSCHSKKTARENGGFGNKKK